jgi:hypothetical protein
MKFSSPALVIAMVASADGFFTLQSVDRALTVRSMSIIDDLKLIFSEDGKRNRAEYERREKEEMEEAQREILERRRNPAKMREYEQEKLKNRAKLDEERKVYEFQNKVEKGYDPLSDWTRLREEGKILIGNDLKRDETTSRLGSEGLIDVRVDERMPYIDQGYVSDDADIIGKFMNIFGGGKKDKN